MASLLRQTLHTTCRRSLRSLSLSVPPSLDHRLCLERYEDCKWQRDANIPDLDFKTRWSSSWYLAAAGFCTFFLMEPSSCSLCEEAEKETMQVQQTGSKIPRVVFVLRGPGSGKGTQCARIVETFGFTHLSAGHLLRAEINSGSQYGSMIQNTIKEGKIVPSEVTIALLQKAMQKSGNDKFLIDGFPRNEENFAAFTAITGIEPEFVIFLDSTEDEMEKRLLKRNQGRVDDNIETIKKRFKVFVESTLPVVQEFERQGKLCKINATGEIDEVFRSLKPLFACFVKEDVLRLTKELLRSIDTADYESYEQLCDPKLHGFERDSQGHLVEGIPFHKYYFDVKKKFPPPPTNSELTSPKITLVSEDCAIATYTRLRQTTTVDGVVNMEAFNETRVWQRKRDDAGKVVWKVIHFHRSKCPLHKSFRKPK